MRESFQGEDGDCPECQETARLRIAQQPWTNRNNLDDVPIRLRKDSLPQRYIPTPPPAYASRAMYGSGYGYAEDDGRRAADPDPSPREVYRRVADWADHVPTPQATGSANTRREMQLYRPRDQGHSRRAESSSSRHSGAESHASHSSRHRSNIYDPRSERHPHSRTEDSSSQSSRYMRASDEEHHRRRYGYPPSLPSVPDGYEISETSIYINDDGTEVTRISTWRHEYQQQDQPEHGEDQNRQRAASHASSARSRRSTHSGSVASSSRGPPPQQQQRRLQ
jgi:hypothetical protein